MRIRQATRIRKATIEDLPALQAMGLAFIEGTRYRTLFRATGESLAKLAEILLNFGDNAAILLVEDDVEVFGMLAIVASPHLFDGRLYADEVVWWIDPTRRAQLRHGPALLRSAEDWARERGCFMIKMVAPLPSRVGVFYERLGYCPIETAYAKEL